MLMKPTLFLMFIMVIIMVSIMMMKLTSLTPALRAARIEQPAVAEMPTHSFVQPATRLKL